MRILLTQQDGKPITYIDGDEFILSLVQNEDLSNVTIPRVNADELAKLFDQFVRTPSKIDNEPNIEKVELAKKYARVRELYLTGA
ncbi:hypothetical protein CCZ20_27500 [Priestia aryabhattai]|uniref:hypothetical protein n=1 Tax=Priestia aryabhattai TaxID=412384 RepID=UPI000B507269|nr:hypothetical protein [Priestia aryabhattai]OVE34253.1 hypothetical protein CCZ20_27500 [Priestia aryabhattai]